MSFKNVKMVKTDERPMSDTSRRPNNLGGDAGDVRFELGCTSGDDGQSTWAETPSMFALNFS